MKKIYTLLALAITSFGFAQYNGTGNFSLVNEINNLTDGYYVITNETSQFLMTSTVTTTGTIFYIHAPVTVESGTITDPLAANVWKIETTAEGKTIYSETTQKYVGWTSGNSATAESTVGTSNTWTFSLVAASGSQPTRISTKLVATPTRQLSYNSNSPRFAVYNNSDQQELQFYSTCNS
nr:hypothetical protein [uncultured Flavobacterium sp.]